MITWCECGLLVWGVGHTLMTSCCLQHVSLIVWSTPHANNPLANGFKHMIMPRACMMEHHAIALAHDHGIDRCQECACTLLDTNDVLRASCCAHDMGDGTSPNVMHTTWWAVHSQALSHHARGSIVCLHTIRPPAHDERVWLECEHSHDDPMHPMMCLHIIECACGQHVGVSACGYNMWPHSGYKFVTTIGYTFVTNLLVTHV